MGKAPPPRWRQRDCSWCHITRASVAIGMKEVVYDGIDSHDQAVVIRRGCFRARNHHDHFPEQISVSAEIEGPDPSGKYQVRVNTFPRASARKYTLDKVGGDKTKLAYNPMAKLPRDENG